MRLEKLNKVPPFPGMWEAVTHYERIWLDINKATLINIPYFKLMAVRCDLGGFESAGNVEFIHSNNKTYFDVPLRALDEWFILSPADLLFETMVAYNEKCATWLELRGLLYRKA